MVRIMVLAVAWVFTPALAFQADDMPQLPGVVELEDGGILVGDHYFASWPQYWASDFFRDKGLRCGLPPWDGGEVIAGGPQDCTMNLTNPAAEYDPKVKKFRIPIVVHVLQRANGTGFIPEARVRSQIDILNEDFLALPGSNGAQGTDIQIEFYLATKDPNGQPTNGITYSTNDTWYNDGGQYYNSLAWDTNRYLNIYTNNASGALGYVPFLPQQGGVGSKADRVVCYHEAFGSNPAYPPFHLGRTATHEIGHYLGLWHTFDNGCGNSSCYTTGDRICDTNPESSPRYGCPNNPMSCGALSPYHNYMDYTDDDCMTNFTPEQARRERCTLEYYRPNLFEVVGGPNLCDGIKKLTANCKSGGEVKAILKMINTDFDGENVTIAVGGQNFDTQINGKKAVVKNCCHSGTVNVQLINPPGCPKGQTSTQCP